MERRKTKRIDVGSIPIGDGAPISIQSMTNTRTSSAEETVAQIQALAAAGCDIVRCAVPDLEAVDALPEILAASPLPVIADIHFDYRLALASLEKGVHGLRINPGNIGSEERVLAILHSAREKKVPIRIGINGGSLEKDLLARYGVCAEALVESALRKIDFFEKQQFDLIKISLKVSSVPLTIAAYRLLAARVEYPFHVGVTEAGTLLKGSIKSALGIGILLNEGIGDTLRVSLTGDPVDEVIVAKEILKDLGLRKGGIDIVSCPTCGRTKVDLVSLVGRVEAALKDFHPARPLTVAVMGCEVNGPGEAKEADYGIASGKGVGLLFKDGRILGKYDEAELASKLLEEIRRSENEV